MTNSYFARCHADPTCRENRNVNEAKRKRQCLATPACARKTKQWRRDYDRQKYQNCKANPTCIARLNASRRSRRGACLRDPVCLAKKRLEVQTRTEKCRQDPACVRQRRTYTRCAAIKSKYGVSCSEYKLMLKQQNGRCAVCKELPGRKKLVIDHDHGSGSVRGLLCRTCNSGIGLLRDDPKLLHQALAYLEKNLDGHRRGSPESK